MKDRIQVDLVTANTSGVNVWSSNVPEHKMRYILGFVITGDGSNNSKVTISKIEEDGSTETPKFKVYVGSTDTVTIPGSPRIHTPILVLEGGTNLKVTTDVGTADVAVIYYDDPAV